MLTCSSVPSFHTTKNNLNTEKVFKTLSFKGWIPHQLLTVCLGPDFWIWFCKYSNHLNLLRGLMHTMSSSFQLFFHSFHVVLSVISELSGLSVRSECRSIDCLAANATSGCLLSWTLHLFLNSTQTHLWQELTSKPEAAMQRLLFSNCWCSSQLQTTSVSVEGCDLSGKLLRMPTVSWMAANCQRGFGLKGDGAPCLTLWWVTLEHHRGRSHLHSWSLFQPLPVQVWVMAPAKILRRLCDVWVCHR